MDRSRVANHAGEYKKQKDGGIDKRVLRAHRRSIDQRNVRDRNLMQRRNIDGMSPLREVDQNLAQDQQEQAAPLPVKPDRREMLQKWRQEKQLKQKLAARENARNRVFKVCHVTYESAPSLAAGNGGKKTKDAAVPVRVSARLAARTEAKPRPDAPAARVTRSRAANQKAEPPRRTTRQRVPSGAGKNDAPQRQGRKRATSGREPEPQPAHGKKRSASGAANKPASLPRVTRARARSEAQGETAHDGMRGDSTEDGHDDDLQPVDFGLTKVTAVTHQQGEAQEAAPGPLVEAAPGPSTEAAPGPSTEAAPGPSTEAAPGPSTEAAPGPSTEAAPGPSFAPADFSFQAPNHLPSFSFTPLSPRSADAFLFPGSGAGGSFLNSPFVSKTGRHSTPKSVTRRGRRARDLSGAEGGVAAVPIATQESQPKGNVANQEQEPVAMATEDQATEEAATIPMATEEAPNENTSSEDPIISEPAPVGMETGKAANEEQALVEELTNGEQALVEEPTNGAPAAAEEVKPEEDTEQFVEEAPRVKPPAVQEAPRVEPPAVQAPRVKPPAVQEAPRVKPPAVQDVSLEVPPAAEAPQETVQMELSQDALQETTQEAGGTEDVLIVAGTDQLSQAADDIMPGPELELQEAPGAAGGEAGGTEDVLIVAGTDQLSQPADDIMPGPDHEAVPAEEAHSCGAEAHGCGAEAHGCGAEAHGCGAEAHDVAYFRRQLDSQTARLTGLCHQWEATVALQGLAEEVQGQIRTTVGQAQLLMDQRFRQFSGLVDACEFRTGEKQTTCQDLQGFWDMVYFQVEDVDNKFDDLEKLKARNWEPEVKKPVKVKKKIVKKPVKKPVGGDGKDRAAARKRLAEAKTAMKAAMQAKTQHKEPEEAVTFDGGFFKPGPPLKALAALSDDRRRSLTEDSQTRRRSSRLTPGPVSQLIQALTHTPGNILPVSMETTNQTPSSASLRRSSRLTPQPITAGIPEHTHITMETAEVSPIRSQDGNEPAEQQARKQSFSMFLMPTSSSTQDTSASVLPTSFSAHDTSAGVLSEPMETSTTDSGIHTSEMHTADSDMHTSDTADTEMHSPMKRSLTTMFDQEGRAKVATPARRVRRSAVNFVSPPDTESLARPLPKTPAPNLFKARSATESVSPPTDNEPPCSHGNTPPCSHGNTATTATATPATLLASLHMDHRPEDLLDLGFTPPEQNPIRAAGGVRVRRSSSSSEEEEPTINLMGFSPDPPITVKKSSGEDEAVGTAVRFAAITPSKKVRDYMGADVIMSPVRRSMRLEAAGATNPPQTVVRNLAELPNEVDYGYQPNKRVL